MATKGIDKEARYIFPKEPIKGKHGKPFRKDEVTEEVAEAIQKGRKGDASKIKGALLKKATEDAIRTPSMMMYSKQTGKKTRVQQLAETLDIPEELPKLPPYLQTFAFRYATETRRHCDWASIFHTSIYTIRYWLLKKDVMAYILKIRQERQLLMAERVTNLERMAYERLGDLLSLPLKDENIETIRKVIGDTLALVRGEPQSIGTQINNQIVSQASSQAAAVAVSKASSSSIAEIEEKLKELDMLEKELSGDSSR